MIPYILIAVGGYLIGQSRKDEKFAFAKGGGISKEWSEIKFKKGEEYLIDKNGEQKHIILMKDAISGRFINFVTLDKKRNRIYGEPTLMDYDVFEKSIIKKFADGGMMADGGQLTSFEKKIKDALKEENKWHFIDEEVDGKSVQLKMFVGKKEVDVQIFKINGLSARMPKNYVGKRETLKMIMDNFPSYADGGMMADDGKVNISHYKVGDEIFVDYDDAWDYCDANNLPYSNIEKTKEYAKGGKVKKPKKWIQDALTGEKGALRRTAKRKGLLRGDENLSMTDLRKLQKMGDKTAKRAHLAETLRKFDEGGMFVQDDLYKLVLEMDEDEYVAFANVQEVDSDDANEMQDFIYELTSREAKMIIDDIKSGKYK